MEPWFGVIITGDTGTVTKKNLHLGILIRTQTPATFTFKHRMARIKINAKEIFKKVLDLSKLTLSLLLKF